MSPKRIVVGGGGPAGLTAAYQSIKHGRKPVVLEASNQVGGISRTEVYRGYRFDIGGHRFFTKVPQVDALWHEILGDQFLTVPRMSRIYYDGKFYPYPLKLVTTLKNLGALESLRVMMSYLSAKVKLPYPQENNLEEWVSNRFGIRLYEMFFKTYTEKVWGISCTEIRADWAAQRIKGLSLKRAVLNALFKNDNETSLIEQFQYPVHGPGMMWEAAEQKINSQGGDVQLNSEIIKIHHHDSTITSIEIRTPHGTESLDVDYYVNSIPIVHLVDRLSPEPPQEVLDAAASLSYRDFIVVALVVDQEDIFPDNWIYVHSPEVKVGRIQNFKNWSPEMVPDISKTCLGMEYFCSVGDSLWNTSDEDLIDIARREIEKIGLASQEDILDGTVIRQKMAYPVYDATYKEHLGVIRDYLSTFTNMQTVGRAGMHRYNNQDHSMLTAMLAVDNMLGADHNVWNVNVERSYHEEFTVAEKNRQDAASSTGVARPS